MTKILHKAIERGQADFGWFKAKYSFSFGQWHSPDRMGFGALRVFNDSVIMPGKGFPEHPHDNMEIITVQLQGRLSHTDVSGTRIIQAGDVQVITAGSGVTHSDLNIGTEEAQQFQIWIYPERLGIEPTSNIEHFAEPDRNNKWQILASPLGFDSDNLKLHQQAWISRGVFDDKSKQQYTIKKIGNGAYIFVVSGEIMVEGTMLGPRDAVGISDTGEIEMTMTARADVLILDVPMY